MINKIKIFLIPLVLTIFIMLICYPGFMSYDSVRMLEEARTFVRGGIFPAFPVYLLRLFDVIGSGVPLLIFTQCLIILFSFTFLLRFLKVSLKGIWISLLLLLSMPVVIGCMLVLWKDVTFSAFLLLALVLILTGCAKNGYAYSIAKWAALLLIVLATLVRLNGASASVVLLAYWLFTFYNQVSLLKKISSFTMIFILIGLFNSTVNSYKFPSFEKLEPNTLFYGTLAWDLVGTSKWANVSLVPLTSELSCGQSKTEIGIIDKIYSSQGSESIKSKSLEFFHTPFTPFPEKYLTSDILTSWISAVIRYPTAYMHYRWDLFSQTIGAIDQGTFEPTHYNRIDGNNFGIIFQDREITNVILKYIEWTSSLFYGKPWFWILLGALSIILIIKDPAIPARLRIFAYTSFTAAIMYIFPFLFLTSSGEVRYSLPTILLCFNCIIVWYFSRGSRAKGI